MTFEQSDPGQVLRGLYASPAMDDDFWAWLKEYLPAADYAVCAEQPRAFVQALHQVAWSSFVEQMVEEEMGNWEHIMLQQQYSMGLESSYHFESYQGDL